MSKEVYSLTYEIKFNVALKYLADNDPKCKSMSHKIRQLIAKASVEFDPERFKDDFPEEYKEYKTFNLV